MLLSVKLKNELKKIQSNDLEFFLKNIRRNGQTVGCSGFIKNNKTGIIIYVNTEKSCYQPLEKFNLYRIANHLKDYGGSHSVNRFSKDESIANDIIDLLKIGA